MKKLSAVFPLLIALAAPPILRAAPIHESHDYASVTARTLLKTDTTSLGQPIRYPEIAHPEVTALEVDIPPGGETGWHTHPVPGYGYVLAGVLTVETADGRRVVVKAGEAFAEMVGVAHNGTNNGKVPVRLIAFFTGGKGAPFSIKQAAPKPR